MGVAPNSEHLKDAQPLAHEDLRRLCARYDGLLESPPRPVGEAERRDLLAMAQIFDLEVRPDSDPAGTWASLRAVLTRQTAGAEAASGPAKPLTVLVTEDDPDAAASLMEYLTDAGHGVVGPFTSAESALAAAAVHTVDVALVDINLAGSQTGVELARALTADWGVPSVFVSGDVRLAAQNAEAVQAIVMKPYKAQDILKALESVAA